MDKESKSKHIAQLEESLNKVLSAQNDEIQTYNSRQKGVVFASNTSHQNTSQRGYVDGLEQSTNGNNNNNKFANTRMIQTEACSTEDDGLYSINGMMSHPQASVGIQVGTVSKVKQEELLKIADSLKFRHSPVSITQKRLSMQPITIKQKELVISNNNDIYRAAREKRVKKQRQSPVRSGFHTQGIRTGFAPSPMLRSPLRSPTNQRKVPKIIQPSSYVMNENQSNQMMNDLETSFRDQTTGIDQNVSGPQSEQRFQLTIMQGQNQISPGSQIKSQSNLNSLQYQGSRANFELDNMKTDTARINQRDVGQSLINQQYLDQGNNSEVGHVDLYQLALTKQNTSGQQSLLLGAHQSQRSFSHMPQAQINERAVQVTTIEEEQTPLQGETQAMNTTPAVDNDNGEGRNSSAKNLSPFSDRESRLRQSQEHLQMVSKQYQMIEKELINQFIAPTGDATASLPKRVVIASREGQEENKYISNAGVQTSVQSSQGSMEKQFDTMNEHQSSGQSKAGPPSRLIRERDPSAEQQESRYENELVVRIQDGSQGHHEQIEAAAQRAGFIIDREQTDVLPVGQVEKHMRNIDVFWHPKDATCEELSKYRRLQRVNQLPGARLTFRKDKLYLRIERMMKMFPKDFQICPRSWMFPQKIEDLENDAIEMEQEEMKEFLLIKPIRNQETEHSEERECLLMHQTISQAFKILKDSHQQAFQRHVEGVLKEKYESSFEALPGAKKLRLKDSANSLQKKILSNPNSLIFPKDTIYVVQRYMRNPLLLNGFRFDLKVYAQVTSCKPLTVHLYEDGVAQFSQEPFSQELVKRIAGLQSDSSPGLGPPEASRHLPDGDPASALLAGQALKMSELFFILQMKGVNTNEIFMRIRDVVIKSMLSVQADLIFNYKLVWPNDQTYRTAFQLLCFELLFDESYVPYLINVKPINDVPGESHADPEQNSLEKNLILDVFKGSLQNAGLSKETKSKRLQKMNSTAFNSPRYLGLSKNQKEMKRFETEKSNANFNNTFDGGTVAKSKSNETSMVVLENHGFHKIYPIVVKKSKKIKKKQPQTGENSGNEEATEEKAGNEEIISPDPFSPQNATGPRQKRGLTLKKPQKGSEPQTLYGQYSLIPSRLDSEALVSADSVEDRYLKDIPKGVLQSVKQLHTLPKVASAKFLDAQSIRILKATASNRPDQPINNVVTFMSQNKKKESNNTETEKPEKDLVYQLVQNLDQLILTHNIQAVQQLHQPSFPSSQAAIEYYKQFEEVVDNILKQRRSKLLSPAQKTANMQGNADLETSLHGSNTLIKQHSSSVHNRSGMFNLSTLQSPLQIQTAHDTLLNLRIPDKVISPQLGNGHAINTEQMMKIDTEEKKPGLVSGNSMNRTANNIINPHSNKMQELLDNDSEWESAARDGHATDLGGRDTAVGDQPLAEPDTSLLDQTLFPRGRNSRHSVAIPAQESSLEPSIDNSRVPDQSSRDPEKRRPSLRPHVTIETKPGSLRQILNKRRNSNQISEAFRPQGQAEYSFEKSFEPAPQKAQQIQDLMNKMLQKFQSPSVKLKSIKTHKMKIPQEYIDSNLRTFSNLQFQTKYQQKSNGLHSLLWSPSNIDSNHDFGRDTQPIDSLQKTQKPFSFRRRSGRPSILSQTQIQLERQRYNSTIQSSVRTGPHVSPNDRHIHMSKNRFFKDHMDKKRAQYTTFLNISNTTAQNSGAIGMDTFPGIRTQNQFQDTQPNLQLNMTAQLMNEFDHSSLKSTIVNQDGGRMSLAQTLARESAYNVDINQQTFKSSGNIIKQVPPTRLRFGVQRKGSLAKDTLKLLDQDQYAHMHATFLERNEQQSKIARLSQLQVPQSNDVGEKQDFGATSRVPLMQQRNRVVAKQARLTVSKSKTAMISPVSGVGVVTGSRPAKGQQFEHPLETQLNSNASKQSINITENNDLAVPQDATTEQLLGLSSQVQREQTFPIRAKENSSEPQDAVEKKDADTMMSKILSEAQSRQELEVSSLAKESQQVPYYDTIQRQTFEKEPVQDTQDQADCKLQRNDTKQTHILNQQMSGQISNQALLSPQRLPSIEKTAIYGNSPHHLQSGPSLPVHTKLHIEATKVVKPSLSDIEDQLAEVDWYKYKYGYSKMQNHIEQQQLQVDLLRRLRATESDLIDKDAGYRLMQMLKEAELTKEGATLLQGATSERALQFQSIYEKSGASGQFMNRSPSLGKLKFQARSKSLASNKMRSLKLPLLRDRHYVASGRMEDYENSKLASNKELRTLEGLVHGQVSPQELGTHLRQLVGLRGPEGPTMVDLNRQVFEY